MIPMRGRMVHDLEGKQRFLAYGQRAAEEIYSVSRAALNALLYRLAAEQHGVEYRFNTRCVDVDPSSGDPIVETAGGRGVDLIVMGAYGKTGVKKFLMGSATEKVIGSAGCAVLVAKA